VQLDAEKSFSFLTCDRKPARVGAGLRQKGRRGKIESLTHAPATVAWAWFTPRDGRAARGCWVLPKFPMGLPGGNTDRTPRRIPQWDSCRLELENLNRQSEPERSEALKSAAVMPGALGPGVASKRTERRCGLFYGDSGRSGGVLTMLTAVTMITGIRYETKGGRTKERSCPKKPLQPCLIPAKANLNGPKVLE